jgi:hypothetical protein
MGTTTPEKVKQLLMEDVVLSDAMATQGVERYTFRAPGQAISYFYGYSQLLGLRAEVEKLQGPKVQRPQGPPSWSRSCSSCPSLARWGPEWHRCDSNWVTGWVCQASPHNPGPQRFPKRRSPNFWYS